MIVTFYSFKGGVGRTFSLVETAFQLAGKGASVVVWDLDLEAPGLQKIPGLRCLETGLTTGTLDLLLEFEESDYTFPSRERLREALVKLPLPPALATPGGCLSFLLPAPLDETYPAKFSRIGWETLFAAEGAGPAFFHKVAAVLEEDFDYLLVDSRTGFTDLSAVCTLQLPDLVVLVFNLNEQNLAGAERVHKAASQVPARTAEKQNVPVLLLANMIPEKPAELREQKLAVLKEKGLSTPYMIPLCPELLLTDEIPSLTPSLRDAVRNMAPLVSAIETRRRGLEEDQERAESEMLRRRGISARAKSFEDQVAELFVLQGHRVTQGYRSGDLEADLRLEILVGTIPILVLVECKGANRPVSVQEVRDFARKLQTVQETEKRSYQGILVALADIPLRVEEEAKQLGVVPQSYRQLLASLVEPIPLEPAIHAFQGTALERLYVELEVVRESELRPDQVPEPRDVTPALLQWLRRSGAGLFLLLGEAGSGKTSFCRRLTAELAQAVQQERAERKLSSARVPLHIELRGVAATTLETLLLQHLQGVAPKASVSSQALLHANREGLLLLLFDGFDEAISLTPHGYLDLLQQLLRAVEGKAKVVITCRPHLFRDRPDLLPGKRLAVEVASRMETPLYTEIREKGGAEVAYVLDLSRERVEEYLRKALPPPDDWQEVQRRILETGNLADLAARPFLLEIVVATLPHLAHGPSGTDLTHLYEAYGKAWFEQSDFRLTLDRVRRTALVEHLARLIWNAPQGRVHYDALVAKATELFEDASSFPSEKIDFELRTAPFLRRDAEGYYTFVHRSFLEFFVARGLRSGVAVNDPACLDLRPITREVAVFLESWPEAERIPELAGSMLAAAYTSARSENALLLLYFHARASLGLLAGSGAEALVPEELEGIQAAFSQLRPDALHLEGADLDGAVLPGVDLHGARLERARLARADLRGACLEDAVLIEADLRFAQLRHARAAQVDFTGAVLEHTDLRDADLREAVLQQTDLSFARLARSRLRHAKFGNTRMQGTGLLGADISPQVLLEEPALGSTHPDLTFRPQFGPEARVTALAWSAYGRCLATIAGENSVVVWDVDAGERLLSWDILGKRCHALAWSPDNQWLAVASTRSGQDTVQLWDVASGKIDKSLPPQEPIGCLVWSPIGKVLAFSRRDTGAVAVWEVEHSETGKEPAVRQSDEERGPAQSLVWSPDGNFLAATTDGAVHIWNTRTLLAWSLDLSPRSPAALRWSQDGRFLSVVFREGGVETLFGESGLRVGGYEAPPPPVDSAVWAPVGDLLAVIAGKTLRVSDLGARIPSLELSWESSEEIRVGWASDGSHLAVAVGARPVEVRQVGSWVLASHLQGTLSIPPSALSWSPRGDYLALGFPKGRVHLWDIKAGEPVELGQNHEVPVLCLSWLDEGRSLRAVRADATTFEFDPSGQGVEKRMERIGAGKILAAVVSTGGRQTVMLLEDGLSVALSNPGAALPLRQLARAESRVLALALSPEDEILAIACDDGNVQLWSIRDGVLVQSTLGRPGETVSLAWSPGGRQLASGTMDGLVRLRNLEGQPPLLLRGHEDRILAVSWSPSGDRVASAAADGMVFVWDAKRGLRLQAFSVQGRVSGLAWAPEGERLAVAHEAGVDLLRVKAEALSATLYALPGGPLGVSQDGYVSGAPEALRTVRFGDNALALYELEDIPERLSSEKVAAALLPVATEA